MRKGEEKRQELLNAAEKLFCARGYESASVQDILTAAGMSKGGFYHHFASKEDVMKALCARRAERSAAYTVELLSGAVTPMDRINAVLHGFMPLRREETAFMAMLLPVIASPEGRAVAMTYQDKLEEAFLPMLTAEVAAAAAGGVVCPPVKESEPIILDIVNQCWMNIASVLSSADRQGLDRLNFLNTLVKYRRAIEVLLDAPYGSIEIIRVEEWDETANRIRNA